MDVDWAKIQPARFVSEPRDSSYAGFQALKLRFRVPLSHTFGKKNSESIELQAELVYGPGPSIVSAANVGGDLKMLLAAMCPPYTNKSIVVYLCGGPGDANPAFANTELNKIILGWGHPILFLDYRGTGGSTPVTAKTLNERVNSAEYVSQFRQDSIVADLEAIRLSLSGVKFTLVGQSFGGWIAMTYVSFLPESLSGVFLTGGVPPIGREPEEVYAALYKRLVRANEEYYARYPEDVVTVKQIAKWLGSPDFAPQGLPLTDGQWLTAQGFMTLGRHFGGGKEGQERVHLIVSLMAKDLMTKGLLTDDTLSIFSKAGGAGFRLPQRPLYAVLHEAIYCSGTLSAPPNWAAQRVGSQQKGANFAWARVNPQLIMFNLNLDSPDPLYFTGEMIHDFMLFDAGYGMAPFQEAAQSLAQKARWSNLYDVDRLGRNEVAIRALIYPEDLFLDFDLCMATAKMVKTCQAVRAPRDWIHGSIKTRPREVCKLLFSLEVPEQE